jgi:uncharacterized membrane protein
MSSELITEMQKAHVRSAIKGYYDMQKLRIASGNRLVADFYMGKEKAAETLVKKAEFDEEAAEAEKKEAEKRLAAILKDYDSITEAISDNHSTVKKIFKDITGEIIKTAEGYEVVSVYKSMVACENGHLGLVENAVYAHPLWAHFLEGVRGCGPLMAGVIISELDPYKARHASSFYKYVGIDVVLSQVDYLDTEEGNTKEIRRDIEFIAADSPNRTKYKGTTPIPETGIYIYSDTGLEVENVEERPIIGEGRSKKAHHLVQRTYVNRDGEEKHTRGITYNAFAKTKLMGVLATSFLRSVVPVLDENGNPLRDENGKKITEPCHYAKIYYNEKNRLEQMEAHADKTPKHRHNMALRKMIKIFVLDLWVAWRTLEGLEVTEPYEVAILGRKPHGSDPSVEAKRRGA